MTVAELIRRLQECDPDKDVVIIDDYYSQRYDLVNIEEIKDYVKLEFN